MKIILMMAMTADGKIARSSDHFPNWTSKEDKEMFAAVTKKHGVVIMGDKTFFTLPGPLPGRLNVVFTLLKKPCLAGRQAPQKKNVMWVKGSLKSVLTKLEKMGYRSVILGGGSFLNTQFLKKKLIDEVWLTIEPKIFGEGLGIFGGDFDVNLKLLSIEKINENSVVTKYKVLK